MTPTDPTNTPAPAAPIATTGWLATLKFYLEPASLRMLSLGFSAGLPLLLVFGTLSFWLREAGGPHHHWLFKLGRLGLWL